MEQSKENPDDIPSDKIFFDIKVMKTDAHNDTKYVQAFVSALAKREQESWPADELLMNFSSMQEYLDLLEGISDKKKIDSIRLAIDMFLTECTDVEKFRMWFNAQHPPDTASAIVEADKQPAHLEEVRVNLFRFLALMKRESASAGANQKNLYTILNQMYKERGLMTDARFLTGKVHSRLKEAGWNDIERSMKLCREYVVRIVSGERAVREKISIDQAVDQIDTTLDAFIQQLTSSPDTTPLSNKAHPQN